MISAHIHDASGTGRGLCIDESNAIRVTEYPPDLPPVGQASRYRYLTGLLGSTGLDSGTTNQNVDGSVTAQEFYVEADPDYDTHVMRVLLLIADTQAVHNSWGNVSPLATGYDLVVTENGVGTAIINKASTGGEALAASGFFANFGDGAQSHELVNWTGTEDAQIVVFDFGALVPGGLRIGRGTRDRLTATVNDDLTGLTEQYVRIYGYRHYPA